MKRHMQDTIYMLVPFLSFLIVLSATMTPILYNIEKIQNSLIAYSECSSKMIDYAFLGQMFNFSDCYINEIQKNNSASCYVYGDRLVCAYKDKIYEYPLLIEKQNK